ncbi:MAG: hypothetical protein A3A30_04150 [Candidatus Terrybacteria bacterium RIFCSPLOWO2_01_FULL_48_14]|nr:MAG: hypothetical protein A3A30_04150 [Candidatus Terrybacteria bacterium RIFCSPLOWO2_01_FULL_48_14]
MPIVLIAVRNLVGEKGRFAITAGGVAFSVLLILVLVGLYQGWTVKMTRFLGNLPADFWIGQKGTRDMSHSVSLLPMDLKDKLASTSGVKSVTAFVGRQVSFELRGKESHIFLVGVDEEGVIAPYKIVTGKPRPDKGEVIVDITFARQENLKMGDMLEIAGKQLTIVGMSEGGNLLVYSYAFAQEAEVRNILKFDTLTNYFLVQTDDPSYTKLTLEENFPDVAVLERAKFLKTNADLVKDTFLPIIGVLVIIALGIGIAVIGLSIFTATIEKSQEYGVLKAIGFSDRELFAIVVLQSLLAGIVGFAAGNVFAFVVVPLAEMNVSGFLYQAGFLEIGFVFVITLLISIVAAFIPIRRIISIDPVRVFKA